MKTLRSASKVLTAGLLTLSMTPMAHAQAIRTWVSSNGDDVNPCSRTAPCKTFAGAISKTAAGGEISVMDAGSYAGVSITKSMTISGDGALAGITVLTPGSSGIVVNAAAGDRVVLRNLSILGANIGVSGIRYLGGGQLHVEDVKITGFTSRGIDVSLTATGRLFARNVRIVNAQTGVYVSTTGGQVLTMFDDVRIEGMSANGFEAAGGNNISTLRDSVISANAQNGILASGATAVVNVEDSMIAYNAVNGVNAATPGATIRLTRSNVFNNQAGITYVVGATVASDGQNRLAGNPSSQAPNGAGSVVVQ